MPRFQNLIDSNRYLYRPRTNGLESFAGGTNIKTGRSHSSCFKPLWHDSQLTYARYRWQNVSSDTIAGSLQADTPRRRRSKHQRHHRAACQHTPRAGGHDKTAIGRTGHLGTMCRVNTATAATPWIFELPEFSRAVKTFTDYMQQHYSPPRNCADGQRGQDRLTMLAGSCRGLGSGAWAMPAEGGVRG